VKVKKKWILELELEELVLLLELLDRDLLE